MINTNKKSAVAFFIAADRHGPVSDEEKQTHLREFAKNQNMTVAAFIAVEKTRTSAGIKHAIALCLSHHADNILFEDTSSLALAKKDLIEVIDVLMTNNIIMLFADSGLAFEKKFLMALREIISKCTAVENEFRSQQIKKALSFKKRKGAQLGGRKFGSLSAELHVVNQIVKLHSDGFSLLKICELLAANDIKTVQGKKWHPTTVKRILERAISKTKDN